MRITTTDPMTLNDVTDLETAPFVIDGSGSDAMEIYSESGASRMESLEPMGQEETLAPELIDKYNAIADDEIMGGIN
ncbi:MAG: hypothetical protein LJE61_04845 [Thiocapsa sp.]|nr:hypothetical protein [Thiocapsa sp.]MCG6984521.1 hypothetical protein [Thiocapsa sp.]